MVKKTKRKAWVKAAKTRKKNEKKLISKYKDEEKVISFNKIDKETYEKTKEMLLAI